MIANVVMHQPIFIGVQNLLVLHFLHFLSECNQMFFFFCLVSKRKKVPSNSKRPTVHMEKIYPLLSCNLHSHKAIFNI